MALLSASVGSDHIRVIGRLKSDELFRYLHVQAQPIMTSLSVAMLSGGSFRLANLSLPPLLRRPTLHSPLASLGSKRLTP
jgi:hypothetical protein